MNIELKPGSAIWMGLFGNNSLLAQSKLNIIIILTDDMGFGDIGPLPAFNVSRSGFLVM